MAQRAMGLKRRRNMAWKKEDTSSTYSGSKSSNRGKNYNTGDYTLKKTKGYDSLQKNTDERRGRKKEK